MKNKRLARFAKNRVEKLDAIATGISIERRHKVFVDANGLNLSAIARDAVDALIEPRETPIEAQARKVVSIFNEGKISPDREIEKLEKLIRDENEE